MKGSTFFYKRVRLPIWPIIPLLFIGYAITPKYYSQIDVIMGNYAAAGLVIVAVRPVSKWPCRNRVDFLGFEEIGYAMSGAVSGGRSQ